ncbi:MAG: circadian clock protein KaiB [Planctomycetales bacterium]|nr:circadian clock protein KaiB [Planctomycetales bacterium]
MTPRSVQALAVTKAVCEQRLQGRYELEVIDIFQYPELAQQDQIIAAPTLVKSHPAPLRRLIGNLADRERLLRGLGLSGES